MVVEAKAHGAIPRRLPNFGNHPEDADVGPGANMHEIAVAFKETLAHPICPLFVVQRIPAMRRKPYGTAITAGWLG